MPMKIVNTGSYTRRRAADSTSSTAKLALSKSLIWQQTISPVVGELAPYKAVWDDYKQRFRLPETRKHPFYNPLTIVKSKLGRLLDNMGSSNFV